MMRTIAINKRSYYLIVILATISFCSCEVGTSVYTKGKNPPSFSFDGSGSPYFFMVREVKNEGGLTADKFFEDALWLIQANNELKSGMANLPPITYGKVPEHFTQEKPAQGDPPPLIEGKIYSAIMFTYNAPNGNVVFIIRNNEVVVLDQ